MAGPAAAPLFGRSAELAVVTGTLRGAGATGQGSGVLVVRGEAGSGKTRLAAEATASVGTEVDVLWGRATSGGAADPYRPLAEIALAALRRGASLSAPPLAPYLPSLARLVPTGVAVAPAGEGTALAVAEGLFLLLDHMTVSRPVAVVVDDAHWVDADTAAALEYLAFQIAGAPKLGMAMLVRADEPGPEAERMEAIVDHLVASRTAREVQLAPLSSDAIAALATAVAAGCVDRPDAADVPLPDRFVTAIARQTEGRPFLVEELVAAAADQGALRFDAGRWQVDDRLEPAVPRPWANAIGARLAALGPTEAQLLADAAVLGRTVDVAVLLAAGHAPAAIDVALDAGRRLRLLSADDADGALRFRHALTQEAIASAMLPHQRAEISSRLADAVVAAHPTPDVEWSGRCADLLHAAGRAEEAAGRMTDTARQLLDRGEPAAAVTWLDRARALGDDARTRTTADMLLVEALALSGDAERTRTIGYGLLRQLEAEGAPAAQTAPVRLHLARAGQATGLWREAATVLDRLLESVGPPGPEGENALAPWRERASALAALVALEEGDTATAEALAAPIAAAPSAAADARCEAYEVLGRAARTRDLDAAEQAFRRGLGVARDAGLAVWRARALHELGTIGQLDRLAVAGLEDARTAAIEAGAPGVLAAIELHLGAMHGVRFEPDRALETSQHAVELSERLGRAHQALFGHIVVAQAHAVAGRRTLVDRALEPVLSAAGDDPEVGAYAWGQCRALASIVAGDLDQATTELDLAAACVARGRAGTVSAGPYRGLWLLLDARRGDDPPAVDVPTAALRAAIDDEAARVAAITQGMSAFADAIRVGRSADPADAGRAGALVTAGLARFASLEGQPGYRSIGLLVVAECALADGWGEPDRWLLDAASFFETAGLDGASRLVRDLLRRAGVPERRRGRGTSTVPGALAAIGVTSREMDVLRLVAEGLTNKAIADRLYLSPRTVKTHVENLLAKTGSSSRTQLAGVLGRAEDA